MPVSVPKQANYSGEHASTQYSLANLTSKWKDKMNNSYTIGVCDKCGTEIFVRENDKAPRYYCYPCAMAKMGETP